MAGNEQLSVSIGTEYDEPFRLHAKDKHAAYLTTGKPSESFERACEWLGEQVRTGSEFYQRYLGKYVAVISLDPPVMEINPDKEELLRRSYERWGYQDIGTLQMDPSVLSPLRVSSP